MLDRVTTVLSSTLTTMRGRLPFRPVSCRYSLSAVSQRSQPGYWLFQEIAAFAGYQPFSPKDVKKKGKEEISSFLEVFSIIHYT